MTADSCPCTSGRSYATCCQRWHLGAAAPTAVQLMRSRYAAYVLGLDAYLLATWHASTRPALLDAERPRWLGLQVRRQHEDGDAAVVEFVARYKIAGRAYRLHEFSRFTRADGRGYYLDGTFTD